MTYRRPYRLAMLATSPALTGEANMPLSQASPVATGEGNCGAVVGALEAIQLTQSAQAVVGAQ